MKLLELRRTDQMGKRHKPEEIIAKLRQVDVITVLEHRLAKYKLPKRVIFADHLPRNTMGKVQKNLLREAHNELYKD